MLTARKITAPRGIRNNNPGNIRYNKANNWQGQVGQDNAGFVVFSSMAYGVRAMNRLLDNYARRGLVTIESIIPVWAPAADNNNEQAYIASVAHHTGFDQRKPLGVNEREKLIAAIIYHENGRELGAAIIEQGVALA